MGQGRHHNIPEGLTAMLRAAILTLLKAGGGQQLGLFGAHVPPASPSSSGAQEQIVHVKEHTRQTSHGVQVVAAHDVRRARATPATPAAAPNPRTRAGQDAAAEAAHRHKLNAAGRIGRDDVLRHLALQGEEGDHVDPYGYVGVDHIVGALAERHGIQTAAPHALDGLRAHVGDVIAAARRDGVIETEHRPGRSLGVRHNRNTAAQRAFAQSMITLHGLREWTPRTDAERADMTRQVATAEAALNTVQHLLSPELVRYNRDRIGELRQRSAAPNVAGAEYLQRSPRAAAPFLVNAQTDATLGIPSVDEIVEKHGAVNADAVEWVRHKIGKAAGQRHLNTAMAEAHHELGRILHAAMIAKQPRAKIEPPPTSATEPTQARSDLDTYISKVANKRLGREAVGALLQQHAGEQSQLRATIDRAHDLKNSIPAPRSPAGAVFRATRGTTRRMNARAFYSDEAPESAVAALRARGFQAHLEHEGDYHTPVLVTDAPEHVPVHEWVQLGKLSRRGTDYHDPISVAAHLATHGLPQHAPRWGQGVTTAPASILGRESAISPFGALQAEPHTPAHMQQYTFTDTEAARAAVPWHTAAAQHEEQRAATQQEGVNSEHTRRLRVGAQQRAEAHRRIATAARLHVAAANGAERGR